MAPLGGRSAGSDAARGGCGVCGTGGSACARLCGSRAVLVGSVRVRVSVSAALAHWSGWNAEGSWRGAGAPAKSLQVRPQLEPQRRGTGEGSRPLSAPSGARGPLCARSFLRRGPPTTAPFLSCGLGCRTGPRLGVRGEREPLAAAAALRLWEQRPRCLPPPPSRPRTRPVKGWAPCGDLGRGAVRRLGAPGRYLCNAGTRRSPHPSAAARGSCHQE